MVFGFCNRCWRCGGVGALGWIQAQKGLWSWFRLKEIGIFFVGCNFTYLLLLYSSVLMDLFGFGFLWALEVVHSVVRDDGDCGMWSG